jgi:hypothetical protein
MKLATAEQSVLIAPFSYYFFVFLFSMINTALCTEKAKPTLFQRNMRRLIQEQTNHRLLSIPMAVV